MKQTLLCTLFFFYLATQAQWIPRGVGDTTLVDFNFQDTLQTKWGDIVGGKLQKDSTKFLFIFGNDAKQNENDKSKGSIQIFEHGQNSRKGNAEDPNVKWKYEWFYFKNGNWTSDKDDIPNLVGKINAGLATGWYRIDGTNQVSNQSPQKLTQYAYVYNVKPPTIEKIFSVPQYLQNCDTIMLSTISNSLDSLHLVFHPTTPTRDTIQIDNKLSYQWFYKNDRNKLLNSTGKPFVFLTGKEVVRQDTVFRLQVTDRFGGNAVDTSDIVKTVRVTPQFKITDSISTLFGQSYVAGEPGSFKVLNQSKQENLWNIFYWLIKDQDNNYTTFKVEREDAREPFWLTLKQANKNNIGLVAISNVFNKGQECADTTNLTDPKDPQFYELDIKQFDLKVPNAFTPDLSENRYFQVYGKGTTDGFATGIISFQGYIFNRWGQIIYRWDDHRDVESGWDGTINGNPAPAGSYFYSIECTGTTGNLKGRESGALLLIRGGSETSTTK